MVVKIVNKTVRESEVCAAQGEIQKGRKQVERRGERIKGHSRVKTEGQRE